MSDAILRSPRTDFGPAMRLGAIGSVVLLVAMALWMAFTNINGAVIASGKLVVRGKPKTVQSLTGGIVDEILVSDGDAVQAGAVLMRFDATLLELRRDIYRKRLAAAMARQDRLQSEYEGLGSVAFSTPPALLGDVSYHSYAVGEERTFAARRAVLEGTKAQLGEKRAQLMSRIAGVEAQIESAQQQSKSVKGELAGLRTLSDGGLIPQNRLLELERREADLLARIATGKSDLAEVRNAIRDAEIQIAQTERTFRENVVSELQAARAEVEEFMLEIVRAEEELARVVLRAPVTGLVHEMQFTTVGGVVGPEREILRIIPVDNGVDVEVQIDPASIDAVYAGQTARLRFPAFDQRTTPYLEGEVVGISPDTITDPASGRSFYTITVRIPEDSDTRLGDVDLVPGMPVEAFLQTPARSVLGYLVEPLTDLVTFAFRES